MRRHDDPFADPLVAVAAGLHEPGLHLLPMLGEGQVLVLLEDLLDLLQQGRGFNTGLGALEPLGKFHVVVKLAL